MINHLLIVLFYLNSLPRDISLLLGLQKHVPHSIEDNQDKQKDHSNQRLFPNKIYSFSYFDDPLRSDRLIWPHSLRSFQQAQERE